MKALFFVSLLMSTASYAADFPVGTFECIKILTNGSTVMMSRMLVSETALPGLTVPFVEIRYYDNTHVDIPGRVIKGIATQIDDDGAITLALGSKGIRFNLNGSATDIAYGGRCTKQ